MHHLSTDKLGHERPIFIRHDRLLHQRRPRKYYQHVAEQEYEAKNGALSNATHLKRDQ